MTYATGEAALATLIATVTGFSTATVTRGKWGVLNSGRAAVFAILKPGPAEFRTPAPGLKQETWTTIIQIWRRYTDDGDTLTSLEADVAAVLALVDRYPDLNDTTGYVVDSDCISASEAIERWKKGVGLVWLEQDITVRWIGRRAVTYS